MCDSQTRSISIMREYVRNAESQSPPRFTVSKFTFSQILWADSHRKKIIFKIKFVKCGSSSLSERKIISSCEVREAFLEEVTSDWALT